MIRFKLIYITFIGILILFSGCGLIYDDHEDVQVQPQSQLPEVYLSVTKAQAAGLETFNADNVDYEDRVHDLALLIFDSATGAKVGEYFDENIPFSEKDKTFIVQLNPGPGRRDFYFVANMPIAALKSITTRDNMDLYMNALRDLDTDLYLNATETKGFPMSRVYTNQEVQEGGNIYSPRPFQPNGEERVKLIRVVAKLEVKFEGGTTTLGVKNVYFKNAYKPFSLNTQTNPITPVFYDDKPLKKVNNTYIYYMPEAKMTAPSWSATAHKPINYFVIEALNGMFYEVPIITYDGTILSSDYLSFATGSQSAKPDYNIYRNKHYSYTINNLNLIEINYIIDPWKVKQSATYMGYGYNVTVDENGKVTISNTIEACAPHSVKLKTLGSFTFSDNSTEKTFSSLDTTASVEYLLSSTPVVGAGPYLQVYYNDALVKTFSK